LLGPNEQEKVRLLHGVPNKAMSESTRIRLRDVESDIRREKTDITVDVTISPLGIYVGFVGFDGKPPHGFPSMPPGVMIQNGHRKIMVAIRSDPDEYGHTHVIQVRKTRRRRT
jgi:hypothetical protein